MSYVSPSQMVGAALAGMFRLLVGGAALALVLTTSRPGSLAGTACGAFIAVYLIFTGLSKIVVAHCAASDLEDAEDRPDPESRERKAV